MCLGLGRKPAPVRATFPGSAVPSHGPLQLPEAALPARADGPSPLEECVLT